MTGMTAEPTPPVRPEGDSDADPSRAPDTSGSSRPAPGWTEIGLGVVGYLAVSIALGLLLSDAFAPGSSALAMVALAVAGAGALGGFALAAVVRVRSLGAFGVRPTTVRWLLLGLAGGVLAWLVNRGIIIGYFLLSGDTENPQAGLLPGITGGGLALAGTMVLAAVIVPIGEELLFRGVVTSALGRYGAWVAVLVSAFVFALAHGFSIVLPAAFVLGVVNALLLRRSGSVWPGVVAHGVNNALVFGIAAVLL